MKRSFVLAAIAVVPGLIALAVAAAGPPPSGAQVLTEKTAAVDGNVTLAPPPDGSSPDVSAQGTAMVASGHFGVEPDAVSATVLASFSWVARPVDENDDPLGPPYHTDVPVWVVSIDGVCSQLVPDTGECVAPSTAAVVDATTGKFVMSFPSVSLPTAPYPG